MAIVAFGITNAKVHAHHFPQAQAFSTASKPKAATVEEMINEAAAELSAKLRAKGITPSGLDADDHPESYAWCAQTVRLGAAIRVFPAMTGQDPEVLRAWRKMLADRFKDLDDNGHRALGSDAPEPSESGVGAVTHVESLGLDTDEAEEDASDIVPRFRASDRL